MIARPPGKKFLSKTTHSSPFVAKIANDNYSPKKSILGWIFFLAGLLVFLGALFWVYERIMG